MTVAVNVETFHLTAKINLLVALKETPDANKRPKDLFSGNRDCRHKTIFARPSASEQDILRQIELSCEVTHRSADRIQSEDHEFGAENIRFCSFADTSGTKQTERTLNKPIYLLIK